MATHGTTQRPSSMSPPASVDDHDPNTGNNDSTGKPQCNYSSMCPFSIPPSPEVAVVRIIRNLVYFGLFYILLTCVTLAINLLPQQRVSLVVVISIVAYLFVLIHCLLPTNLVSTNLVVLYKTINKRLIFDLLAIATIIVLFIYFLATNYPVVALAATIPTILVHAVFSRVGDDHFATDEACADEEMAPVADHDQSDEKKDSTRKIQYNFSFMCPFNIPPSPEAAALRIIRNLSYFRLYFMLFVWVTLVITLVPKRKQSLIFLVAMSAVAYLYALILYLLPTNLVVPYKTIDKRIVFALLAIATMVELILTAAATHLFVTLAATIPIILVLAALLRVGDDYFTSEEACAEGETAPYVYKIIGDDAKVVDLV